MLSPKKWYNKKRYKAKKPKQKKDSKVDEKQIVSVC